MNYDNVITVSFRNYENECDICESEVDKGARSIEDYDYVCAICRTDYWQERLNEVDVNDFETLEEYIAEKDCLEAYLVEAINDVGEEY